MQLFSDDARRKAFMPEGSSSILNARLLSTAHKRLARLLRPGLKVLDVGCGTGVITRGISEAVAPGGRAVGIDMNVHLIQGAHRAHSKVPGLSFVVGDCLPSSGSRYL